MTTTCQKCIHYELCKTRIDFNEYALEMQKFKCSNFAVRCIHCQHFKTNINKENYCDIHSTTWDKFYVRENDFCSFGIRR